jgi:hypothetical protein
MDDVEALLKENNQQMSAKRTEKILKKHKNIRKVVDGEEVICALDGLAKLKIFSNSTPKTFLVLTPTRIIFYRPKIIGYDVQTMPLEKVQSISTSKGALFTSMTIYTANDVIEINKTTFVDYFVGKVNELIS